MEKTILLIGGIRQAHRYLYAKGYQVIWFGTLDNCEQGDHLSGAKLWFNFDKDEAIDTYIATAKMLAERFNIVSVIGFHDQTQLIAGQIAQALSLPCNVDMVATGNTLDKGKTRALMAEVHQDIVYRVMREREQGKALFDSLNEAQFPLILKPLEGAGSEGIYRIDNAEQGQALLSEGKLPAIVESFVAGCEFSVEGFSENGKHRIVMITQKQRDEQNFVETAHFQPAAISVEQWQIIAQYTQLVLTRLGIKNGISHTEVILRQGDKQPVVVESHTRPGGDYIPEMVEKVTGINLFELAARQALGEQVLDLIPADIPCHRHVGIGFFFADKAGIVEHISGKETLEAQSKEDESIIAFALDVVVGQQVKTMGHSDDRLGYLVYQAPSAQRLREQLKGLSSQVKLAIR